MPPQWDPGGRAVNAVSCVGTISSLQSFSNQASRDLAITKEMSSFSSSSNAKSRDTVEPVAKKSKTGSGDTKEMPSSLISCFVDSTGERAGAPVDLPVQTNSKQLEQLVNALLGNAEPLPYAVYVNNVEVETSLADTLSTLTAADDADGGKGGVNFEDILQLRYQPLSVFRVRPVTRCVETMPGHTDAILHISYSPDGTRLASGGGDKTVRFWNVVTSLPSHTCTGHRHHVLCTAWSPDGASFASSDKSGEIRIWDPKTGKMKLSSALRGHTKWVTFLCFEPLHSSTSAERMASASKDHTVKVWNVLTGKCETTISGHLDSVECVKWGGTGLMYTASRDRTIKVWAIDGHGRSQQKLVRTLSGHAHRINSLAMNCDYVLRTGAYQVQVKGRKGSEDEKDKDPQTKAREKYTAVVGAGGTGERLVSGSDDFTLFLWAPQEDKKPLARLVGHQALINHIAFSPDGRFLASASFDKKVKIWCGVSGKFLHTLTGHVGSVYQVAWSADSGYVVSASKDSTCKVWNMKAKDPSKAMNTLPGHMDEVYALDWSPNGTQAASGSKDRTIKIWRH